LAHKIGILFLVILLLQILPGYLPVLGKWLGRKLRRKTRFARKLLDSTEKPGGPLAQFEKLIGKQALEICLAETPAVKEASGAGTVEEIGRKLAACSHRNYIPFRFIVVNDPGEPNACAIPGGSILVTEAFLDLHPGQDELAGILAHEVAHIDCCHSLKAIGSTVALQKLIGTNQLILSRATGLIETLLKRGYSQENEFEADREGAQLAKRAGFDPRGLRHALEMLENNCRRERYSFFSTHPPTHERINELRKHFG
jgi:predicted Zn-dependent protease